MKLYIHHTWNPNAKRWEHELSAVTAENPGGKTTEVGFDETPPPQAEIFENERRRIAHQLEGAKRLTDMWERELKQLEEREEKANG